MPEKSTVSHKKNKKFLIWRLYFCIFNIGIINRLLKWIYKL